MQQFSYLCYTNHERRNNPIFLNAKKNKGNVSFSYNNTKYYKMSQFHNAVEQIMIENATLSKTRQEWIDKTICIYLEAMRQLVE